MDGQVPVTNGETTGTSGGRPGTNGAFPWAAWGLLAALTAASLAVNVSSILMEVPPDARNFEAWEPLLWEGSSGVVLLALAPLVWRALQHVPIRPPLGAGAADPPGAHHTLFRGACAGDACDPAGGL